MITLKQESTLIKKLKSLTELELRTLFEELADHFHKNKLIDAVSEALDLEDYQGTIRNLEDDVEAAEYETSKIKARCNRACHILACIENLDDDIQNDIDKAIAEIDV